MKYIFFFVIVSSSTTLANIKCYELFSKLLSHKTLEVKKAKSGISDVVARITRYYPGGIAFPQNEKEIIDIVNFARKNRTHISVKAGGFSQGGQWAIEDGIIVDISNFKKIQFVDIDTSTPSVIVRPGTTWKEIQEKADKLGLANSVQQSSNIFTVGGALGINSHGRDISYGQIINVTNWVRAVLPDGQIVKASKTENPDIFRELIGSLGLRGLIIEANISLRPNSLLETVVFKNIPKEKISQVFGYMRTDPQKLKQFINQEDLGKLSFKLEDITPDMIHMGYGRSTGLNLDSRQYMDHALMYMFVEVPWENQKVGAKIKLKTQKESKERILPFLMEAQRLSNSMKSFREILEARFMRKSGDQLSLNYLMNPPVDFLLFKLKEDEIKSSGLLGKTIIYLKNVLRSLFGGKFDSTDILKEYFIPVSKVAEFESALEKIIRKYELNNLNNTYRIVPDAKVKPIVNYAKTKSIAFVLNFNVGRDRNSLEDIKRWSEELAIEAYRLGGTHYLAYGADVSTDQLILTYPGFIRVFDAMMEDSRRFGDVVFLNEYIAPFYQDYIKNPAYYKNLVFKQ